MGRFDLAGDKNYFESRKYRNKKKAKPSFYLKH